MKIAMKQPTPSRDDAMRMTRSERNAMLYFMHAVCVLEDIPGDMEERLGMIPDGVKRVKEIGAKAAELQEELLVTIPMNQRMNIDNTAHDYEVRMMPKATPTENNVLVLKEEFRRLVDYAREHCRNCVDDDFECQKCEMYRLLESILPLDNYHGLHICPYNLGEWLN